MKGIGGRGDGGEWGRNASTKDFALSVVEDMIPLKKEVRGRTFMRGRCIWEDAHMYACTMHVC